MSSDQNKMPVHVNGHGAIIHTVEDAYRIGSGIIRANLFSKKFKSPEQAMVAILAGRELGLGPIASCRGMNVIEGQPAPGGDLALSLVRHSGKMTAFKKWYTGKPMEDDWTCHVSSQRSDEDEPVEHSFSVKEAKAASLWARQSSGGKPMPWSSYPARMLYYRALGFHLRDQYGDVLMGAVIAEELQDYPQREPFDPSQATGGGYQDAATDPLLEGAQSNGSPEPEPEAEVIDQPEPVEQEAETDAEPE